MDYALKTALIDVSILISVILLLFFAFHFLTKNVSAASFVGKSKKAAKNMAIFSVSGIILLGMLDITRLSGYTLIEMIMVISFVIVPPLALSVLILASFTHFSCRLRFMSLFKNKLMLGIFALLSAVFSLAVYLFGQLVKFTVNNLDGIDGIDVKDIVGDGRPRPMSKDHSRPDSFIGTTGHYDMEGKYRRGSDIFDD